MKQVCIALNCPKGGVGKSTLSKELGATFSMVRIDEKKPSVCIVDMNIDYGDISAMLKIPPCDKMLEFAQDIKNNPKKGYKFEDLAKYIVKTPDDIYILPAPRDTSKNKELITYDVASIMLRVVKQYFDVVIIDTGNNIDDVTIASFEQSSQIFVVVTDETTSINCAATLLDSFHKIGVSMEKVEIVLNKYAVVKGDRSFSIKDIEEVLGSVYASISFEENMAQSNSTGLPAVFGKETPFKKDIIRFAKTLMPEINEKALLNAQR